MGGGARSQRRTFYIATFFQNFELALKMDENGGKLAIGTSDINKEKASELGENDG